MHPAGGTKKAIKCLIKTMRVKKLRKTKKKAISLNKSLKNFLNKINE